jgi:gliding motility-associated-like protein
MSSVYSVVSTLPGGYNEWSFSNNTTQSTNFNITWDSFGMFPLSVVNWVNGCPSNQEQTVITIVQCPNLLYYIPNSFTPDGDEHNNTFKWTFTSGFDPMNFNILIFNRWGELIFESNNSNGYWDGTYGDTMCPLGVYTYKLQFDNQKNDGKYLFIGNVNLIR